MNWSSWLLWGFVATLVLTTIMAGSQGLRLTRMNLPYMLGAMFTPNRDRAKLVGLGVYNAFTIQLMRPAVIDRVSAQTTFIWCPEITTMSCMSASRTQPDR